MLRRAFLSRLSQLALASVALGLAACKKAVAPTPEGPPAPEEEPTSQPASVAPKLVFLSGAEALVLAAALEVMLPQDQAGGLPSGAQVGVLAYMDGQLAKPHFAGLQRMMHTGLQYLDRVAMRGLKRPFAELTIEERSRILQRFQQGNMGGMKFPQARFFSQLHSFALEGYLGAPKHGGNRDKQTWHALGIDLSCHNMFERCG